MLFPAYAKREELEIRNSAIMIDPYYKYYNVSYSSIIKIDSNFWNNIQLVSLNKDGEICGYFRAEISRPENCVDSLGMFNLDKDNPLLFALDMRNFFKYLLFDLNTKKINFTTVVANPITKKYDYMVEKIGGRVVGIKKHDCLIGNKYCDLKLYEIINNHYTCSNCGYKSLRSTCKKCDKGIMVYKKAFDED